MNRELVDRIVQATLYEGYILYPYRPTSVKNQVRWTFGGVHPQAYSEASGGIEPWTAQTECLLDGGPDARVQAEVRFLQLVTRTVRRQAAPTAELDAGWELRSSPVASLEVGGVTHRPWEEAVERDIELGTHTVGDLLAAPVRMPIALAAERRLEPLRGADGGVIGVLVREHQPLAGAVELSAAAVGQGLHRVGVHVANTSDFAVTGDRDREAALLRSLVSTHAILGVEGGRWLSLADPPDGVREAAAACRNSGMWPVLVGQPGDDRTILASPIILEDHPAVAPESAGDLFDATEIDEILTLRILALTDEEKAEMRAADDRARALLDRTESLSGEQLMRLHGTLRELRPVRGEQP